MPVIKTTEAHEIFVVKLFLVNFSFQLLDYYIFLKARHDELIHESITLHNHELI